MRCGRWPHRRSVGHEGFRDSQPSQPGRQSSQQSPGVDRAVLKRRYSSRACVSMHRIRKKAEGEGSYRQARIGRGRARASEGLGLGDQGGGRLRLAAGKLKRWQTDVEKPAQKHEMSSKYMSTSTHGRRPVWFLPFAAAGPRGRAGRSTGTGLARRDGGAIARFDARRLAVEIPSPWAVGADDRPFAP
jgi:hypothetical protein